MKNLLKNIFTNHQADTTVDVVPPGDPLTAQNEIQLLKMEIEARDKRIQLLSQEVERLRERQDRLAAETATARFEALLSDLAGPASQIITQANLLEKYNKPVQARDVISVARRAVKAMERHGMVFDHQPGDEVLYDSARHIPIGENALQPGQAVIVRFAGASYQGKMLTKTIVE